MRIDLNFRDLEPVQTGNARRAGEGSSVRRGNKQDDAVLSSGDSSVAKLTAAALAAPDIRSERVSQLRESITSGTYSVQPSAVADAMLHDLF